MWPFGIVIALGVTDTLTVFRYGVSPTDPATFAVVAILITAVALLACLIPVRLATRIDPAAALRAE
jgi:ABC-type antimicrobial peptide transport system permease subunit